MGKDDFSDKCNKCDRWSGQSDTEVLQPESGLWVGWGGIWVLMISFGIYRPTYLAAFVVGLGVFLSCALFEHKQPGWGVNSRLCLSLALVRDGSFQIDEYQAMPQFQTDDVAEFGGHCYSDKAIGVSVLAAVPVAVMRVIYGDELLQSRVHYWGTLFVSGLSAAALGALLTMYLAALGQTHFGIQNIAAAALISVATIFGTQYFGHATLLMPYAPCAAGLVGAMVLIHGKDNFTKKRAFAIGLLLGFVILCETLWGVAAVAIAGVLAWQTRRSAMRVWWPCAAGMFVGVLPFILYSFCIFGTLTVPYQYERNELFREAMAKGFLGTGTPNPTVLYYLTVHPYRGLFVHSPFLIVALGGLWLMFRRGGGGALRPLAVAIAGCTVFYLLFNSGYYMWWGGWSFSPRHLAMIPVLLAPALMVAWIAARREWWVRGLIVLLIVVGLVIHGVVVCMDPQWRDLNSFTSLKMLCFPEEAPPLQWLWMRHIYAQFAAGAAPGTVLGKSATLAALGVIWAVAGFVIFLCESKDKTNRHITTNRHANENP